MGRHIAAGGQRRRLRGRRKGVEARGVGVWVAALLALAFSGLIATVVADATTHTASGVVVTLRNGQDGSVLGTRLAPHINFHWGTGPTPWGQYDRWEAT